MPGPTYYAACADSNIITTANGGFPVIEARIRNLNFTDSDFNVDSAYDCCVLCQTGYNCHGSIYASTLCTLASLNTTFSENACNPGGYLQDVDFATYSQMGYAGQNISNGPCGSFFNAGVSSAILSRN